MTGQRLFHTAEAVADLDAIWDYIANDNPIAADHFLDELHSRFLLLLQNPELGELQPLLADGGFRRFVYRKYVIYYKVIREGIVLVRILHGARETEQML